MRAKVAIGILLLIIVSVFTIKHYTSSHKAPLPQKQHAESDTESPSDTRSDSADELYQEILQYKSSTSSKLQQLEHKVNAKQAFDNREWFDARSSFMRIIADDSQDFQAWLFLCKTLQQMQNFESTEEDYASEYRAARIKAEEAAQSDLDKSVIKQLDLIQDQTVRDRLQTLLQTYPTEFAPYFLDIPQQTDTGTACISWTHPLLQKRDFHYENAISLHPKVNDLGVIARGNKLCLEGLQFGENYQLTFNQGFPGEHEAKLAQEQTLNLFIPHRKPSIHFRERGYILSSFGQQVVPFIAVNVPKVKVKIIHIPERNIQSVQANWFSNQIGRWEIDSLKEEHGELIWQGTYHSESELNKTGISGLPIDKMLGKNLQPGVYVIEARISDESYDSNEFSSQALIVSDIGLSTYNGPDGLHIIARNLNTAMMMEGVQVSLIAKNNRVLATAKTDTTGLVHFAASTANGIGGNIPAFLTASLNGKQFTVLNLRNEAFDLSDRGATGRPINGPVAAYVFPERGIYRPGETVHLLSLLRQVNGNAQSQVPLTIMVYRPDGVLAQTSVLKDAGDGAYQLDYPINNAAPTGLWSAAIYLDPRNNEIGHTSFEVNDFVPPRIEVKALANVLSILPHQNNPIQITAQYYFGPPGTDLKVEAESLLNIAEQPFPQWQGYQFGLEEENWDPLRFNHKGETTDNKGQATIDAQVDVAPQTSHLLQLDTTVTVFEVGGRGQRAKQITEYWHQPFAIGIKPRFKERATASNTKAAFDIIALNQKGELQTKEGLSYTLYAEQHDYIWFRSGNEWQYEIVTRDKVVSNGKVNLSAKEPFLLEIPVDSGLYRLEILDEKIGVATSLRFSAGWLYSSDAPDKPDVLELKIDHDKAMIKSPFAGELFLAVAGQTFKPIYTGKIGTEGITLSLPALKDLSEPGAYLIGTVYRPADIKKSQMPTRAIGVHWFNNEKSMTEHKIDFAVESPPRVKSSSTVEVKIKVPANHKKMRLSAALVDEATLALVGFKSPDPFNYFFSQRELAFQLRDSYGFLINPFGARPGSFEEGGDGSDTSFSPLALAKLPAKSYKVVSLYSGIIDASDKEIITIPFAIPEFSGKLRLMAVAWDEKGLGHAESSIIVRDDVDVYFVLPRFLAPKDQATIPLVLRNMDGKEGEYTLQLNAENQQIEKKIFLQKGKETQIPIDLKFDNLGVKSLQLKLTGPDNFTLSRSWEISVRPKVQPIAIQQFGVVKPKDSLILEASIFKNQQPTSQAYFTIGGVPDFGSQQLTKELISYPYMCLEQTTSRMLATALSLTSDKSTLERAFNQLSSLQKIDGSFGLWSASNQQEPWLSLYAGDVMHLIKKQGLPVPIAITENLSRWTNEIQQSKNISLAAYASYLNAKEGKSTLGALRYFVETHQQEIVSKQDLSFIAAAFAYYGDSNLAALWFNKAIAVSTTNINTEHNWFGSDLRDTAILVALLAETTQNHPKLFELANALSAKANDAKYLSTQEKAWLVRAAYHLREIQKNYQLSFGKESIQGQTPLQKRYTAADLKNPIKITNNGANPVFYSLSTLGEPIDINQLTQQGFQVEREIYTVDGKPADTFHLKSGERYVIVIKGQRLNDALRHVLLVDLLPAGFEIEDPNLLKDNLASAFPWLGTLTAASRVEGRDDRFVSAYEFDRESNFSAAYFVRAVSKGTFTYPAVYIEAMYQSQNFKYGKEQILKIE